ncbi:aminoacyl-tRNA hydrolase [Treponema phagedenis]|uniref:Peptidyl-tRNA hydrolase n=1 Tax=Treponema phagedenis TaxID=162 RepID=A0A0B7GQX5_TREPH|nr:aminoacyl-tRNA hydrolase [Treponema phagedenis]EFW38129.1 aminoacyl-tRNA hydrolase [Treponema phagedenis F0421]NVP24530.1 aminoacyl-tRNA hydrolase [Treponema phagedenis]QEJ94775.1 aminoacyl-tRNA hydrolase [Treponema phagedenis]QEJ97711.1 aminoacyl-tRNA hydrolase [Treponema phagedenis]QEK00681.1 aminoacyl-tRNA hydrolase [Treponema phagedenis]
MIKLIAFLGNHGREYARTRHNAAWIISEKIAVSKNVSWQHKFSGNYAQAPFSCTGGEVVHLLKPETYMNLSGVSVKALVSFYKLKPEEILVVHDELELAPAAISFKWAGGLGGHNGLRSIKAQLGTADFWRLRIGIGRPDFSAQGGNAHPDIAGYVLSLFSQHELEDIEKIIPSLDELFAALLPPTENLSALLKTWGKKPLTT